MDARSRRGATSRAFGAAHAMLADLLARRRFRHPRALPRNISVGPDRRAPQAARAARRGGARPDRGTGRQRARIRSAGRRLARPLPRLVRARRRRGQARPVGAGNAVRVMTVHGAKGLEAPLVILADATHDPAQSRPPSAIDRPADRPDDAGAAAPPAQATNCVRPYAALDRGPKARRPARSIGACSTSA